MSTVGIVGAGKVGTTLARHLLAAGDRVLLAGSGDPVMTGLITATVTPGAEAVWAADAVSNADLVVLALPFGRVSMLDAASFAGKTVVDATNHWEPVDGRRPDFAHDDDGTSEWIAGLLPGARVVKAFGHLGYHDLDALARPRGHAQRIALAAAGDDPAAVAEVAALIDRIGFDAVSLDTLASGRAFEPGTAAFGRPTDAATLRALLTADPVRLGA